MVRAIVVQDEARTASDSSAEDARTVVSTTSWRDDLVIVTFHIILSFFFYLVHHDIWVLPSQVKKMNLKLYQKISGFIQNPEYVHLISYQLSPRKEGIYVSTAE